MRPPEVTATLCIRKNLERKPRDTVVGDRWDGKRPGRPAVRVANDRSDPDR